jgi:hypothetical protein
MQNTLKAAASSVHLFCWEVNVCSCINTAQ